MFTVVVLNWFVSRTHDCLLTRKQHPKVLKMLNHSNLFNEKSCSLDSIWLNQAILEKHIITDKHTCFILHRQRGHLPISEEISYISWETSFVFWGKEMLKSWVPVIAGKSPKNVWLCLGPPCSFVTYFWALTHELRTTGLQEEPLTGVCLLATG